MIIAKVEVTDQIAASADKVWALIGSFDTISDWVPSIVSIEASGSDVRATRLCTTPDGAVINESLVSLDAAARTYSHKIGFSPLPLENYISTIKVADGGDGNSTVSWNTNFDVVGALEDEIV